MKKLLVLVALVAVTLAGRAFSFSVEVSSGQMIYLTVTGDAAVKVVSPATMSWEGYTTPTGRLVIPATVQHEGTTYSVTAIERFAFQQCTGLTAVSIPGSVAVIGQRAFAEDTMLASVTIGEGVQRIEMMAFFMCSSLDTIVLPTTVNRIGVSAFEQTAYYNNSDNWIDNVLLVLGGWLLRGSQTIVGDVEVPEGITGLANNAFFYCQRIERALLPSTLMYVGEGAFKECYALDTVRLGAMVPPSLYDDSFEGVPQPLSLVVPCGTLAAYASAAYWSLFDIIEASCGGGDEPWTPVNPMPQPLPDPLPQLGIGDAALSALTVTQVAGGLTVAHVEGLSFEVYDLTGRRVAAVANAAGGQFVPLAASGIYLLRIPAAGVSLKVSYCR